MAVEHPADTSGQADTPDPEAARVGTLLRTIRKDRGWTTQRLGQAVGRSRANLSNIEAGRRSADPALLRAIAAVYRIDFPAFVGLLYPAGHELPPALTIGLAIDAEESA